MCCPRPPRQLAAPPIPRAAPPALYSERPVRRPLRHSPPRSYTHAPRVRCYRARANPVIGGLITASRYPDGMSLSRLAALRDNRWLRIGLLVAVVGIAIWGVASQWTAVQDALHKLSLWH